MTQERPEISAESTLTDRYQTTIPAVVRKALGLSKGDKLQFLLDESGGIRLSRQKPEEPEHVDPVLAGFLDLLAKDIEDNPQNLREIDSSYFDKWEKLLGIFESDEPFDPDEKLDFEPGENDDWLYPSLEK
jgi:antitoxin PrlF